VYFQAPPKTGNHRALGDIRDSIEELKYYRATVFVPLPGPTSEDARDAAARLGA
jgi:oligoribonuclease